MVKRQSLQQVVLGKLDRHMQINNVRTPPHTTHKNSKWIKDLHIRQDTIKLINCTSVFFSSISQGKGNKSKNKQMRSNKMYKLLHSKGKPKRKP